MDKKEVIVDYTGGMSFEGHIDNHSIQIDAKSSVGGEDLGPTPKPLLLISLAGCTGMDVVSLLKKMRQSYDTFKLKVTGELTEEHPKYYHTVNVDYYFSGANVDEKKCRRAVQLSVEKYCGVMEMFRRFAKVETNTYFHNS